MSDTTVNHPDKSGRQIPRAMGEDDHVYADRVRFIYSQWKADQLPKGLTSWPISELDRTVPPPLLLERLDPTESTVLYGPGGVGKGSLACSWIWKLTREGHRVLVLDYEGHAGEWSRRLWGLAGDLGDSVEWTAPLAQGHSSLFAGQDAIRELIKTKEITYVVIDSAMMACGGDPLKPEIPIQYAGALQMLDVPTLTLAHVTKLHDARYPFGSVMWHNLARVTWSLMTKGEDVLLMNRKANNYRLGSAQIVTMTWQDDMLREVSEKSASLRIEDKIAELLLTGPMSPKDITAALNDGLPAEERISRSGIGNVLQRSVRTGGQFTVNAAGEYLLRNLPEDA